MIDALKAQLIRHEDIRLKPYKCPTGYWTIGVGRNLDSKGITLSEAHYLLENDIREAIKDLMGIFAGWDNLPQNIRLVLADMRFNLGRDGFREFRRMIRAVQIEDWIGMIYEMRDSKWYGQVGERGRNLVKMVQEELKP